MNLALPAPIKPSFYTKKLGKRPSERKVQQGEKEKAICIQVSRAMIGVASPGVIREMKGNLTPGTLPAEALRMEAKRSNKRVKLSNGWQHSRHPKGPDAPA